MVYRRLTCDGWLPALSIQLFHLFFQSLSSLSDSFGVRSCGCDVAGRWRGLRDRRGLRFSGFYDWSRNGSWRRLNRWRSWSRSRCRNSLNGLSWLSNNRGRCRRRCRDDWRWSWLDLGGFARGGGWWRRIGHDRLHFHLAHLLTKRLARFHLGVGVGSTTGKGATDCCQGADNEKFR